MDARYLTPEQRDKLKMTLIKNRDDLARIIKRMRERSWYTDDPLRLCLTAAYDAVHAAVNSMPRHDAPTIQPPEPLAPAFSNGLPDHVLDLNPEFTIERRAKRAEEYKAETAAMPWVGKHRRKKR